jgi:hypothetical protein
MAVETIGITGETDGFGDSKEAFLNAHHSNSNALLNLADGKKKNAPRPVHDPEHPDNQWPKMVYHPEKGNLTVGTNLKGLSGVLRKEAEKNNETALANAVKSGYRSDPYLKPQIAVLDPATEKAALQAKNQELEGKLVAQADQLARLQAAVDTLVGGRQQPTK